MIEIDGKRYPTIADAAGKLKVSVKTLNQWINRKIVDPPPALEQGLRTIRIFPPEYIEQMRQQVKSYRQKKAAAKGGASPK